MRRWAEAGSDAAIIEGQPLSTVHFSSFSYSWVTNGTKVTKV